MDTFDYRKATEEKVLNTLENINFQNPDWHKPITELDPNIVIWFLKELVEKKEYVVEIFELAKIYVNNENPSPQLDNLNEKIKDGDEVRNIYTVRGSTCWLLTSIAATFRTEFYSEIISILEKLAFDPVYYVRIQATYPISFFTKNIHAKQHSDGALFDFKDEDRKRILDLSFRMLEEHRDLPRVLEGIVNIFDPLRTVNEIKARQILEYFFYNSKGQLQPEYLTRQGAPLLLYFAEYRVNVGTFESKWFQDFVVKLLKLSEKEAPYLRSTFIWHIWKEIQADPGVYSKFKKYTPFFLTEDFEIQTLGQYDFLTKEVLKVNSTDGVELFKTLLKYVLRWAPKYNIQNHAWLLNAHEIVEEIAKQSPEDLLDILNLITSILSQGVYIGYLDRIYESYLLVPNKEQGLAMHSQIAEMFEVAKKSKWAKDELSEKI